ncbi:hypothetical protein CCACVL1_07729, partial [Corchorus capsularis]
KQEARNNNNERLSDRDHIEVQLNGKMIVTALFR